MDEFETENAVAEKHQGKPTSLSRKKNAVPLAQSTAANIPATASGPNGRSVEEIYQKMSQLEHILARPDTYIGSTEHQSQLMWILEEDRMVQKFISFVPGLYKIFDEILVNAADNKVRDSSMDLLKVDILPESNTIRVYNNGAGIPVEIHKTEGVYVPELIFGHLLTSSNYDDNEKKVTGGRNGYGAKLANIFSHEFVIETCDGSRKKRYRQVFSENMMSKANPQIKACKASENWTSVEFKPDLSKFHMECLEKDTVALMSKRVYDLAGVLGKGVKVYLNGKRIEIKGFSDYVDMYLGNGKEKETPRVFEKVNDRWEVCVSLSEGSFQQVSFVNSICTYKGGTHVNNVTDQITTKILEIIAKRHKNMKVKSNHIKNHLWVFLNSQIENPAFDSQTKEYLTLRASSFGSKCVVTENFVKKVLACGVMEAVLSHAAFRQNQELKKNDGAMKQRVNGIPKLDDANDAGSRNSAHCTLILTEGDSAKSLAVSGLSVVGRDKYGVFPLRGKLLNVRDATHTQIMGNAEINHIKQILGLQHGKVYTDVKGLRYGHVMIMTDQDQDGSHIKGLIMNFIHHFYPSLLKIPGFLVEFITPIIKATKGRDTKIFYTIPEYETWKTSVMTKGWTIKYYKGLGTSTSKEAKEYFAALEDHKKEFVWEGDNDGDAIAMAFSKKRVEDRKAWLRDYNHGTYLDHSNQAISYSDFVHKELILFSRADLVRSIPSMVDGLKPGQRKILFSCFKRNLKTDIKVAQLSGYVAEHSAYHHGEASLASTIVGLAQDFVGSNNINLLVPSGQFGTRLQGGKDCASPRYIFTRLAPLARHLFNPADDVLLNYLSEEGQSIEPEWYVPIIPLVLVNGAEGIGTGWSTSIPNYNPRDIVDNLKRLIRGDELVPMHPWYKSFMGQIEQVPSKSGNRAYAISGCFQETNAGIDITELPVRKWTQDYKEFLECLVRPENKAEEPFLQNYKEYHTDVNVHFSLEMSKPKLDEAITLGIEKKFKLQTTVSTGNMMLWDKNGVIRKFETPEEIISEFYDLRILFYRKRHNSLIKVAEGELQRLSNKMRFILEVISGAIIVNNRRKKDIEADLEAANYDKLVNSKSKKVSAAADPDDGPADELSSESSTASYDYLLSMPIWSLTLERVQALKDEAANKSQELEHLKSISAEDLWLKDLDEFVEALEQKDEEDRKLAKIQIEQRRRGGGGKAKGTNCLGDSDDEWSPGSKKATSRRAPVKKSISRQPSKIKKQVVKASTENESTGHDDTESFGSLTERINKMSVYQKTSKPKTQDSYQVHNNTETSFGDNGAEMEQKDVLYLEVSDGEPEVVSPHPLKLAQTKNARASQLAKDMKPKKATATTKRKPVIKKGPLEQSKVTPQASRLSNFDVDSPSPAVAHQGKVRRIRPSPFHKGSSSVNPTSTAITTDEIDVKDEVKNETARPRRAAAKKTYVESDVSTDNDDDDDIEIISSGSDSETDSD